MMTTDARADRRSRDRTKYGINASLQASAHREIKFTSAHKAER
jgi:hypothetical protein